MSHTAFLYFFCSETPSRIRNRPLGVVPPPGGSLARSLVTFAVRAQSCVRRSNVGACVYVHVAPFAPGRGRSLRPLFDVAARGHGHLLRHVHMYVLDVPPSAPSTPADRRFRVHVTDGNVHAL